MLKNSIYHHQHYPRPNNTFNKGSKNIFKGKKNRMSEGKGISINDNKFQMHWLTQTDWPFIHLSDYFPLMQLSIPFFTVIITLNNVVVGAPTPSAHSQKSKYNVWLPHIFTTNSLLLTWGLMGNRNSQYIFCILHILNTIFL